MFFTRTGSACTSFADAFPSLPCLFASPSSPVLLCCLLFFFLSVWESDCYLATGVPIYCRWRSFSDSTVNRTRLIRTQQVQIITHKTSLLITLWHGLCVKCSACCLFSPFTNCTCKAAMLLCHQRPYLIGTSCLTRVAETRMSPTCVIYLLYWRTLFSPDAELTDTNLSSQGGVIEILKVFDRPPTCEIKRMPYMSTFSLPQYANNTEFSWCFAWLWGGGPVSQPAATLCWCACVYIVFILYLYTIYLQLKKMLKCSHVNGWWMCKSNACALKCWNQWSEHT